MNGSDDTNIKVGQLNYLMTKFGYESYLEIGIRNSTDNFDLIAAKIKHGVDPNKGVKCTHNMTSDEFFQQNTNIYDLIFIDGLHVEKQVLRDIENSIIVLAPNGTIAIHDCNPIEKLHQSETMVPGTWNGTVWKAFARCRMRYDKYFMCVLPGGMGIIRRGNQKTFPYIEELTFEFLDKNRKELLNLMSFEEFKQQEF